MTTLISLPELAHAPRSRRPYPSDVSDVEWAFVAPHLALLDPDCPQRRYPLRDVFNGLRYVVRSGCAWRMMPNDLPPWDVVYQQMRRWEQAQVFDAILAQMRDLLRHLYGKPDQPTMMIVDSRTLKSTPESGQRAGYDAGKKVRGSKAHVAVDVLGNLLALSVTSANIQDRAALETLAKQVQEATGESIEVCLADGAYTGEATQETAHRHGIELVVVKRTDNLPGFQVLPKRWIVERSLGWLTRFKRLAKDYERLPQILAHLHLVAFVMLIIPRLFARYADVVHMLSS